MPSLGKGASLACLVLAACASGPRATDLPPETLPPPRLGPEDVTLVAKDAGASLAAATSARALLGRGPLGFARVANLIPWPELRDLDERTLRFEFEKACGIETVAGAASYSLLVDVIAFAHRIRDGAVSVEYSFDFLLVDPIGGTPWATCRTRALEGGRGDATTQVLAFRDLDLLAADAAAFMAGELRSVHASAVRIIPCPRERRPEAVTVIAFEDRLRAKLLEHGLAVTGDASFVIELRVDALGVVPETGAERHEFYAGLCRKDEAVPFQQWNKITSR